MSNRFEYVMSGYGILSPYIKPENLASDELRSRFYEAVRFANGSLHSDHYDFSVLYNAYTEADEIEKLTATGQLSSVKNLFADSGGLQVVSLGREIDAPLKEQIYTNQATYSSVAMCFDEIPLVIDKNAANANSRSSVATKLYDAAKAHEKAVLTGQNINEQARFMREHDSKSKIMLIMQGNTAEEAARFAEVAYDQIDPENRSYIEGVAGSFACIGKGMLEICDVAAAFHIANLPTSVKSKFHLLGVGSIGRFVPIIEFARSGFFGEGTIVSFDSTTHSRRTHMAGQITMPGGSTINIARTASKENEWTLRQLYERWIERVFPEVKFEEYLSDNLIRLGRAAHLRESRPGEELKQIVSHFTGVVVGHLCVDHFMETVRKCGEDDKYVHELSSGIDKGAIRVATKLKDVSNYETYLKWRSTYSRHMESIRVGRLADSASGRFMFG